MTFIQLCQRVRQECGIAGTGPSTVIGQTGELKRVVDWTASAYREICLSRENWKFLRSSFSVNTVIGTETYAPTTCTDTDLSAAIGSTTVGDFGNWLFDTFRIYKLSAGIGTRVFFWPLGYQYFRDRYQLQPVANSAPVEFTTRPRDKAIIVGPKPNDVYVISGEYYRVAPDLLLDADTPLFPTRFHEVIVNLAKLKYGAFEEDGGVYSVSEAQTRKILAPLIADQIPRMELGPPLA